MKTIICSAGRFRFFGAFLLAGCCATQALALDAKGDFAIDGGGGRQCSAFSEAAKKKNTDYFLFGGWVEGYVSATNQYAKDTYDITPWQTTELLLAALGQYCEKNPKQPFIVAVNSMLGVLQPGRLQAKSELVMIQTDKGGVALYKAVIEAMQRKLAEDKLYAGPKDGAFSPALKDALRDFQVRSKLLATGFPDQLTLNRLFNN
ncbi:peptidoglycan-binding domain-containing protein [Zoogloea sp.]|uniref:peptidoglycan-binding domain-containing protein n=1 Tax=Zoogloea sp. TaxID=49181 RepID=UPI0026235A25|nr:peptidoglycan-binding domain-containing protein [Zoogloea sp.]